MKPGRHLFLDWLPQSFWRRNQMGLELRYVSARHSTDYRNFRRAHRGRGACDDIELADDTAESGLVQISQAPRRDKISRQKNPQRTFELILLRRAMLEITRPRKFQCLRWSIAMIGNIGGKTIDIAFRRVRDLDVSMHEQLRTFAETTRRERPEFAAAVDRLVERLRRYGAGESAPQIGEPHAPVRPAGPSLHRWSASRSFWIAGRLR